MLKKAASIFLRDFAGADLLMRRRPVVGIRTGDKGIDKDGHPKGNFEPGIDIRAKLTILAEGSRGSSDQATDPEIQS